MLALVLALTASAWAQNKIGIVNSQDVLEKSAEGKRVLARLQDADKQNQAKVATLDDQIRRIQTELSTQRITMTEEAILQKSADLERKNTERKRIAEDAYSSMQEMSQRLLGKLQSELIPIVEQIGKEKGLDIVFDLKNSGAVYWSPTVDLTAEVIKRYDASKAAGK
jgi:Skp family chaperone for outer membrane proteins